MSSPGDYDWKWSSEHRDYYRYTYGRDGKWGNIEWARAGLPNPDSPPPARPQPAPRPQHVPQPQQPQTQSLPQSHLGNTYPLPDNPEPNPAYHYPQQPHIPTGPAPVHPQQPGYAYNPQYPHQATPFNQTTHTQTQTSPHSNPYPAAPGPVPPYEPTTPPNPAHPAASSPPSGQSDRTQNPAYTYNPNQYHQGHWSSGRHSGS